MLEIASHGPAPSSAGNVSIAALNASPPDVSPARRMASLTPPTMRPTSAGATLNESCSARDRAFSVSPPPCLPLRWRGWMRPHHGDPRYRTLQGRVGRLRRRPRNRPGRPRISGGSPAERRRQDCRHRRTTASPGIGAPVRRGCRHRFLHHHYRRAPQTGDRRNGRLWRWMW